MAVSPHTGVCLCASCRAVPAGTEPAPARPHAAPRPSPRDQLNALRREKQKLVEKIMDQYRVLEPGPLPRTK